MPSRHRRTFRTEVLTHLVEHVVPEELEHVAVAVLGPAKVAVELGAVDHGAELGQEPEEPRGLDLLGELVLDGVASGVGSVQMSVEPSA